jgi:regulator of sigma E protease
VSSTANIVIALAGVGAMLLFHELGHLLAARCCRVRVELFSFGLGREIFGFFDRHGTRWRVSAIPFAGTVRFYSTKTTNRAGTAAPGPAATTRARAVPYDRAPATTRLVIVLCGPLFSILFAYVSEVGNCYWFADKVPPVVGRVNPGSAAESAGLVAGDRILAIEGQQIVSFEEIRDALNHSAAPSFGFKILRDGAAREVRLTPDVLTFEGSIGCGSTRRVAGIVADSARTSYSLAETLQISANLLEQFVVQTAASLRAEFTTTDCAARSGVQIRQGENSALSLVVLFSLAYGAVNLAPIRRLDGSEMMFCLLACLRGRPLRERTRERVERTILGGATVFFWMASLVNLAR